MKFLQDKSIDPEDQGGTTRVASLSGLKSLNFPHTVYCYDQTIVMIKSPTSLRNRGSNTRELIFF
jgi:hypothetical protein